MSDDGEKRELIADCGLRQPRSVGTQWGMDERDVIIGRLQDIIVQLTRRIGQLEEEIAKPPPPGQEAPAREFGHTHSL